MTDGSGAGSHARAPDPGGEHGPHPAGLPGELSLRLVAGLLALFLGLPVVVLVVRAIATGALATALRRPVVLDALSLSLHDRRQPGGHGHPRAAAGVVLARRTFRGSRLLEAVVDLPIVLPPAVAGLGLLLVFGRRGLLGEPLATFGI